MGSVPRWEFRVGPRQSARELVPATISSRGINVNGVWIGGAKFPACCAKCKGAVSHFQLLEAAVWALSLPKTHFPGGLLRAKQTANLRRSVQNVRERLCRTFSPTPKLTNADAAIDLISQKWKAENLGAHCAGTGQNEPLAPPGACRLTADRIGRGGQLSRLRRWPTGVGIPRTS